MLKSLLQAVAHIFSPRVCPICESTLGESEEIMCTDCLLQMPRTHFHTSPFNIIHQRLGPAVKLDRAAAWFYYVKQTSYAQLLVDTKYGGRPLLGRKLGEAYAREIEPSGFFDGIDALVPVPMHYSKRLLRGFNQTEEICRGISRVTGIPQHKLLAAPVSHGTQSHHTAAERMAALKGTFAATAEASDYDSRHLLVVDDIITTGATMQEALVNLRHACPSATISVLALAATM